MHLQLMPADGFNHIETRHIRKTDVSNRQAELTSKRLLDSVMSGDSDRHTITVVLKNHLEGIGDAPLILDNEDCRLLFVASFRHDFRARNRYAHDKCWLWILRHG